MKDICQLYKLRHYINMFGTNFVAKNVKTSGKILEHLYDSGLHGSVFIDKVFKSSWDDYMVWFINITKEEIKRHQIIEERILKNEALVEDLFKKRTQFANIGTNKAKRRLNKLAKDNSIAKAVRLALEIEDKNIQAKKYDSKYRNKIYAVKHELIMKLVRLFKENNWKFGIQSDKSNPFTTHVIYFEIPQCEQISWHFIYDEGLCKIPLYEKEWDGKINSTLDKIEKTAIELLKEYNLL